jgi:hypothetical protein
VCAATPVYNARASAPFKARQAGLGEEA